MRALVSNLEASRNFEAPPSPQKMLKTKRKLWPRSPLRLSLTTDIPRLSPLNALATPRRRPKTGLGRRR
jgi:hypothetical protein